MKVWHPPRGSTGFELIARGLPNAKLRVDYHQCLLSLCSDVGLAAESKSGSYGADFLGLLLPVVAEICFGFDPTVDVEPSLLKLFRNLWFYVALFGLAPPVLNHSSPTKPNATPSNTVGSTTAVSLQAVNGPYMWNPQWCSGVKHICQGTSPLVVSSVKWLEDELHLNALHNPGSRRESGNEKVAANQRSVLSAALETGSRAQRPYIPGQALGITSDEALSLPFKKKLDEALSLDELTTALVYIGRPVKTDDGIKVTTDHGEELMADVVLFATDTYWVMLEEGRITQYAANILKKSINAALNLVPAEPLCDWNGFKSDVQILNHLKFLQTCTFPQKLVTYNIVEREDTQAHWPTESGLITAEEASFDIFKFLDKIWGHDVTGPKQASNVDSAICALLNYTTSSLSIVADAVAALSCEALKTDTAIAFNFFTDSGDGFSDKDRAIEELGEKLREGTQSDMEKKLVEAENEVKKLLERALHLHIDVVGVEVQAGVAAVVHDTLYIFLNLYN
ncbi:hypothetical protein Tco_0026353 [Tanacetum coccineum]